MNFAPWVGGRGINVLKYFLFSFIYFRSLTINNKGIWSLKKKDRSSRVKICNFTDHVQTQIFTINQWNLPKHLSDSWGVILFIHLAILRYVKEFKVSKKISEMINLKSGSNFWTCLEVGRGICFLSYLLVALIIQFSLYIFLNKRI